MIAAAIIAEEDNNGHSTRVTQNVMRKAWKARKIMAVAGTIVYEPAIGVHIWIIFMDIVRRMERLHGF